MSTSQFDQNYSQNFSKLFDPQQFSSQFNANISKAMQQWADTCSSFSNHKTSLDSFKKLSTICTETYSTCAEKQLKIAQSTMEDSIECLRDLSTCKGVEDYMSKQSEWSRKLAEKCQSNAQELASTMQKGSTQCTDVISKLVTQNTEWATNATQQATSAATKAGGSFTSGSKHS